MSLPAVIAEIVPEDPEVTTGAVLAGLCVMAMLAGSLSILLKWRARHSHGQPIIPQANRPLLKIPVSLLVFGLLISIAMALMAIVASIGTDSSVETGLALDFDPALALYSAVQYDIVMILILGIPVLILNQMQRASRSLMGEPGAVRTEDSIDPISERDDSNPYAAPATFLPGAMEAGDDSSNDNVAVEPWRFGRELRFAAEVCMAAWLPTAILRIAMVLILQDEGQHPFLEMIMNGVSLEILLLIAFTAVVLAPVMEELLYRVIILGGMLNRKNLTDSSTAFAIGISSVLFAFAHGFPDSVALLPLAAAIGWTYHRRRSYRTVVLIHVLFNGFNLLIAGLGIL